MTNANVVLLELFLKGGLIVDILLTYNKVVYSILICAGSHGLLVQIVN